MSKYIYIFFAFLFVVGNSLLAQTAPLDNTRICLDPGHGGQDADDRPTDLGIGPIYYESNANWDAVNQLKILLELLGADVKLTKTTNDPEAPDRDPTLADRVQVANAFGADYFHSFHTNGFTNPETNYSLVLYPGPQDGVADFPESVEMALIMAEELAKYMRTTSSFARADIPFTGFTNGLGVLNNLSMPGTLSEASFHSNLAEGRRLMNSSYLRGAAWAIVKSFLQYFEEAPLDIGELGGIVSDPEGKPLNGIEVILDKGSPEEKIYNGDQFLNGFYFFDSLRQGQHSLLISKTAYDSQLLEVNIEAGKYREIDASLSVIGGAPSSPELEGVFAHQSSEGVTFKWSQNPEISLQGYRLYYATDDNLSTWALVADENTLDGSMTSFSVDAYTDFLERPDGDVYHFRLSALAESGAVSGPSDTYSRKNSSESEKVLVVDGFDRVSGSYREKTHTFATDYLEALRESNTASVSTVSNEACQEDPSLLDSFDLILWFIGDESTADESLSNEEQAIISNYLQSGGKLIITGAEIAWDLDNRGSSSDRAFYRTYLKARYGGDGELDFDPASGIPGSTFENIVVNFGQRYIEDFPDELIALDGAENLLSYNSPGGIAAIGFKGDFPNSIEAGGLINIGFALETASAQEMESFLRVCLEYLNIGQVISKVVEDIEEKTDQFEISLTPNPSQDIVRLQIQNVEKLKNKSIEINVFDSNGRLKYSKILDIYDLREGLEIPSIKWPTGNYFIRASNASQTKTVVFTKIN